MSRLRPSEGVPRDGRRLVPAPPPIFFTERTQPGLRFSERMTGWWSPKDVGTPTRRDYEDAFERGRLAGRSIELVLTIESQDLEATLRDPHHRFRFVGSATIAGLETDSRRTQTLLARGDFKLFVAGPDEVVSKQMVYEAELDGLAGERWQLDGFKALRHSGGFEAFEAEPGRKSPPTRRWGPWRDQTRLFFKLWRPNGAVPSPPGLGVLTLSASDFCRQLATIRSTRTTSVAEAYDTIMRFGLFFAGVLRDTYGGPLARSRYAPPNWWNRPRRALNGVRQPKTVEVETDDDVTLRLTHYEPTRGRTSGHVVLAPGFGVRADSFAIDTVKENLVEYLGKNDYHVWLFDYRASPELELDPWRIEFSIDHIAKYDWPAALRTVCKESKTGKVDVVAHCVGAMSFMMAALGGHLRAGTIDTAILSQVGAHPVGASLNELKAIARLGVLLERFGLKSLRVTVHAAYTYRRPVFDRLLKYYPTEDPCDNPVCRRVRFVFGESYLHANLNRQTHDAIIEMFGNPKAGRAAYANLRALRHLAAIVRRGTLVDEEGDPYLTDDGLGKLEELKMQLCLMSGELNAIFPKRGIETTQAYFKRKQVRGLLEPIMLPDYAHMDCFIGADAARVFQDIVDKLGESRDRAARASTPSKG
jgi:hypothetical protein